jgi:predicted amidohydrolase
LGRPQANRTYFEAEINTISGAVDLIVLPEMFSTGFTMNPSAIAETMQGETVLDAIFGEKRGLTGSVVIKESANYYNRMLFVFPSGEIQHYDKRHLFTLAGEDKVYTKGTQKLIIDYLGWKICPFICYDLFSLF